MKDEEQNPRLTILQAAAYLGMGRNKVSGLAHSGQIPCDKEGARFFFSKDELDRWIQGNSAPTSSDARGGSGFLKSPKVLNILQAAEYLGLKYARMLKLVHSGAIPSVKAGTRYLLHTDALDAWAKGNVAPMLPEEANAAPQPMTEGETFTSVTFQDLLATFNRILVEAESASASRSKADALNRAARVLSKIEALAKKSDPDGVARFAADRLRFATEQAALFVCDDTPDKFDYHPTEFCGEEFSSTLSVLKLLLRAARSFILGDFVWLAKETIRAANVWSGRAFVISEADGAPDSAEQECLRSYSDIQQAEDLIRGL